MLRAMATYVMLRKTLKEFLSQKELDQLTERSLLKPVFGQQDGDVFVARLPELVASEAANVIACELGQKACQGSEKAAQWLSSIAANLPFGDLVAAQAIIDTASREQDFPFNVVAALIELRPRSEKVKEGTRAAMLLPGYERPKSVRTPWAFSATAISESGFSSSRNSWQIQRTTQAAGSLQHPG